MSDLMSLKGKVIIVTGAAQGVGRATAELALALGAKVGLVDMKGDALQEISARFPDQTVAYVGSVSDADFVASSMEHALSHFGKVDGLVNCAGIGVAKRVIGREGPMALADFDKVIKVNLIGSFNMLRLATAEMSKLEPLATGERGVVISTASVAAYDGQIGQAAYSASKGGIVAMTLPIARDLARLGIRNMTIAPGIFGTPMLFGMPQEVQDALAAMVPFPSRLGTPNDYARLAQHIIENDMLNGEVIRLDGAIRLAPR